MLHKFPCALISTLIKQNKVTALLFRWPFCTGLYDIVYVLKTICSQLPFSSFPQISSYITIESNNLSTLSLIFIAVFAETCMSGAQSNQTRIHCAIPHFSQTSFIWSSLRPFSVKSDLFTSKITGSGLSLGSFTFSLSWFFHFSTFSRDFAFRLSHTIKHPSALR